MPRSRSRSLLSRIKPPSPLFSAPFTWVWVIIRSTSVVLPWSTCAMMAMLRISM